MRSELVTLLGFMSLAACGGARGGADDGPRYVVVGGALTETVFALGAGDAVVGVDRTSIWPAAAKSLPQVGMPGQLSVEGVLALGPTVVIADPRTATPALDQLRAAGVRVELVDDETTVAAAKARVRRLGSIVGAPEVAEALVATLERELAEGLAIVQRSTTKPRALFLYARGHRTLLVGGRRTAADAILSLSGAENVMAGVEGFKPIDAEAIVAAAPEVLIVPAHGLESLGGIAGLVQVPGLAMTPAGKARRVIAIDDLELLGFGPRLGRGVLNLARALHEGAGGDP